MTDLIVVFDKLRVGDLKALNYLKQNLTSFSSLESDPNHVPSTLHFMNRK